MDVAEQAILFTGDWKTVIWKQIKVQTNELQNLIDLIVHLIPCHGVAEHDEELCWGEPGLHWAKLQGSLIGEFQI